MEYEELVSLWGKFDDKLNRLEELNTTMIKEMLIKRPKRKLNFFKFKTIESMLLFPLAILLLISPNIIAMEYDWKFFLGGVLVLPIVAYVIYSNSKTFQAFRSINIGKDSVIESAQKSNRIKKKYKARYKYGRFNFPIIYAGILLVKWNAINWELPMIIFISILFILLLIFNSIVSKIHKNMIAKWTQEMEDLY